MKLLSLAIALMLLPAVALSQNTSKIYKYSIGIEMDLGHSFPNFDREQDRWKATFYPAGGISIKLVNRLSERWITDLGLGVTGYALTNKGLEDKYTLDFASPTLSIGCGYNLPNPARTEHFLKLTCGGQLGYQGEFVDRFESYDVRIVGKQPMYIYIRPEIGMRKNTRMRIKGTRKLLAYEIGTFFRYNFQRLGTAQIAEPDFTVTMAPRGNIIGGYFKLLFPVGKKRVKKLNTADRVSPTSAPPKRGN